MEILIQDNGIITVVMERESSPMQTVEYMKETSLVIKQKVMVFIHILMVQNTKVNGKIIKEKVKEYYNGKTAKDIKEIGSIIKSMDLVN